MPKDGLSFKSQPRVLQCCMNCVACNGVTHSAKLFSQRQQQGTLGWPGDCSDSLTYIRRGRSSHARGGSAYLAPHEYVNSGTTLAASELCQPCPAEASSTEKCTKPTLRERRGRKALHIEIPRQKTNISALDQQCFPVPSSLKKTLQKRRERGLLRDVINTRKPMRSTNTQHQQPGSSAFATLTTGARKEKQQYTRASTMGARYENLVVNQEQHRKNSENQDGNEGHKSSSSAVHISLSGICPTDDVFGSDCDKQVGGSTTLNETVVGQCHDEAQGDLTFTLSLYLTSMKEAMNWFYDALTESRGCLPFISLGTSKKASGSTPVAQVKVEEVESVQAKGVLEAASQQKGQQQSKSGVGNVSPFSPSTDAHFPISRNSFASEGQLSGSASKPKVVGEWDSWW